MVFLLDIYISTKISVNSLCGLEQIGWKQIPRVTVVKKQRAQLRPLFFLQNMVGEVLVDIYRFVCEGVSLVVETKTAFTITAIHVDVYIIVRFSFDVDDPFFRI